MAKPGRSLREKDLPSRAPFRRWFLPQHDENPSARASALYREVTTIRNRQQDRELAHELRAMLYGSAPILGLSPSAYARQATAMGEMLSLNVIQSLIDTANAKVAKTKPKPMHLTSGGNYERQKDAKARTKFMEGMFDHLKVYDHGSRTQKLGGIFGTGHTKAYIESGRIKLSHPYPWEIIVDDAEAQHRENLQTMYERRYVDKYVLADYAARYEKEHGRPKGDDDPMSLEDRVLSMTAGGEEVRDVLLNATADLVCVYEGWHLPTWEGNDDGCHILATRLFPIFVRPWRRMRFPFSLYDWEKPFQGYWGKGIAEILTGIQIEINELLGQIQNGHHLIRGWWSAHRSANLTLSHINNDLARIMLWSGEKEPRYVSPEIIAPEIYQHLSRLYGWSHDMAGVSEAASHGDPPAGITAGVALRTANENQVERLIKQGQNYEEYFLDLDSQICDLCDEIAAEDPKFMSRAIDRYELVDIEWRRFKNKDFITKVFSVSAYASDPAGRRSDIQEDIQAGWITPDEGMDLLGYPDTEEYARRRNGWRRCVEADISSIVDRGIYCAPEPTYRLDGSDGRGPGARELVRDAINDYKNRGVKEERLDLLRTYAQAIEDLIKLANPGTGPAPVAAAAPGAGAAGAPPPGGPLSPAAPPPNPAMSPI
jgi:hypothetical protein